MKKNEVRRKRMLSAIMTTFLIIMLVIVSGCGENSGNDQESTDQAEQQISSDEDPNAEALQMLNGTGRTQYTADFSISRPETMEDFVYVKGSQSIAFRNDSEDTWDEIVLREFSPSVLKNEVFVVSTEGRTRPYNFDDPQHTAIESVSQGGDILEFKEDSDPSIVRIKLKDPLPPGETATIDLTFNIRVASGSARQGYEQVDAINKDDPLDSGEITVSLEPILPVLAKYIDGDWICHEYFEDGECSFTDCADYHVTVKVPDGFKVAASGKEALNDDGTYSIEAENMRDFAVISGDSLNYIKEEWEGKTIRVWYYDNGNDVYLKAAKKALSIAVNALTTFREYYGEYAYDELDLIFTPFHHAGMEAPGILRIDDLECLMVSESDDSGEGDEIYQAFRTNIVHEIAHEWFYSAIGNDCFKEPWLDEGFARFSELIFMEKNGLSESAAAFMDTCREKYDGADHAPVNVSSDECSIELESGTGKYIYGWTVYDGSALFLYDLREAMGEDSFDNFMHSWYTDNMNSIVTTSQFLDELYKADDSDAVQYVVNKYMRID